MRTRLQSTPLQVLSLESRVNPAGTITASLVGGVLTLKGDDNDNVISSMTIVGGLSPSVTIVPDLGTTIDDLGIIGSDTPGNSVTIQGAVNSIRANFAGGNDTVTVDGTADFILSGSLNVDLGDGDNVLSLQTTGKLNASSVIISADDGKDNVVVAGGSSTTSTIAGNVLIDLGIGRGDQNNPNATISRATVARLNVLGLGGIKLSAQEGDEEIRVIDTDVKYSVTGDGGQGAYDVTIQGGTIGSVALNSVGTQPANPTSGTVLRLVGTTVSRSVNLRSQSGVKLDFDGGTAGSITMTTGKTGYVGATFKNVSTINGNVLVNAYRPSIGFAESAKLTINGNLTVNGVSAVDLAAGDSELVARNISLTSTTSYAYYRLNDANAAIPDKLTVNGSMNIRGTSAIYEQSGGEATILTRLSITATVNSANFSSDASYSYYNAPGAKTTIVNGMLSVQGPSAYVTQTESELTTATGISIQGQQSAVMQTFPRSQSEDPLNAGVYSTAAGAKTTVEHGNLSIRSTFMAGYYQTEGIGTYSTGVSVVSQQGSGEVRFDVGEGFNSVGPKMSITNGTLLVQGPSAGFIQTGGDVTIAKGLKLLGTNGVQFIAENGETHDTAFIYTDLPSITKVTAGPLQAIGGEGEAQFRADGGDLNISGDVSISGKDHNRIQFGGTTGTHIGGNLTVTGAQGEPDWFIVGSGFTVDKNTSINLGTGTNVIDLGGDGGNLLFKGNLNLQTGNGSDQIEIHSVSVLGNTSVMSGAGADLISIVKNASFSGSIMIDSGAGDDQIEIANVLGSTGPVSFTGKATIKTGVGNDTLILGLAISSSGDANTRAVFGTIGSTISGDLNLNRFDDELSQFDPANLIISGFSDPTP